MVLLYVKLQCEDRGVVVVLVKKYQSSYQRSAESVSDDSLDLFSDEGDVPPF